jgi:predicted small secreted protein
MKQISAYCLLFVFLLSLLGLNGCNTIAGVGKDLERAGKTIKENAEEE